MTQQGLSEKEVLKLRAKFGFNTISAKESSNWFSILFSQLKSPLIYILIAIGVISLIFREYFDFILIWSVVLLNTVMGFSQEYHVEKSLLALRKILKPTAWVIRDGQRKMIQARELVPGDIAIIQAGDKVPADGKLVEVINLLVNEAILTGEEEAVGKSLRGDNNLLFMGTTVIAGRGMMEVGTVGRNTAIGKIGQSLSAIKEQKTPIQHKLEEFSKSLAKIIIVVSLFIFLTGLLYETDVWEMFRFAIILAIAAIPEGLPIAITVILALGIRRILKRQGLVKKLISIETLGSTSVICTDKTGTLTEGVMKVVRTRFKDRDKALMVMTLASNQRTNLETAIWDYLRKVEKINPQQVFNENQRVYEEPFDSEKKYMLTMNRMDGDEKSFLIGAAEIVLSFCDLPQKERDVFSAEIEEWAGEGLKIMGLAFKEKGDLKEKKKFIWLGLLAIEDPLRKEAKEAIAIVRQAGIKVKIVTGDYQKTAEKVALNLGLEVGPENIMDGAELESITELKNKIGDIVVFARVTPHQKQKIVRVLQQQGEIVAMTGDGVNDTPALKKADIGVAVGDASDMAKEVADLILLDNNFKTIVSAVEEGRLIFSNIKKVVAYVLSNSFVEIFLIFGAMLLNLPFPLTVVQILWLHLICDGPPDIVLGFEPKERGLMKDRPADLKKESVLSNQMKVLIFGISFIIGILCLLFFKYVLDRHEDLALARSTIFTTVAMVDLIYIFSFKNLKRPLFKTENFFKNKFLFLGVAYGLILTFAAVYLPALNRILGTQPLDLSHWGPVLGVALVTLLWTELVKYFYNRHGSSLDRQNKIK